MRTELGKIASVKFGRGGYQDAMFGLTVNMAFDGGGGGSCRDFKGSFLPEEHGIRHLEAFTERMLEIARIMKQAKAEDSNALAGTPIEATFDGMTLQSWRVLTEVL